MENILFSFIQYIVCLGDCSQISANLLDIKSHKQIFVESSKMTLWAIHVKQINLKLNNVDFLC